MEEKLLGHILYLIIPKIDELFSILQRNSLPDGNLELYKTAKQELGKYYNFLLPLFMDKKIKKNTWLLSFFYKYSQRFENLLFDDRCCCSWCIDYDLKHPEGLPLDYIEPEVDPRIPIAYRITANGCTQPPHKWEDIKEKKE